MDGAEAIRWRDYLGENAEVERIGRLQVGPRLIGCDQRGAPSIILVAVLDEFMVHADGSETFWRVEVGAMPPTAANGTTHEKCGLVDLNGFIEVEVALEDQEEVMLFEEAEHGVSVFYCEGGRE